MLPRRAGLKARARAGGAVSEGAAATHSFTSLTFQLDSINFFPFFLFFLPVTDHSHAKSTETAGGVGDGRGRK